MGTLLYSPGIRVVIETAGHGIIDVSEDLQNGTLTLTENQSSSFSFTLINHRRKYDGIFTPNDLISVQMKRLRWMPVFAGYLDEVPYFSVYPRNIPLRAHDTLKKIKYRLWDPGAPASVALLNNGTKKNNKNQIDGGLRDKLISLLTDVGDWPLRNIHIGRLPENWVDRMDRLREKMAEQTAIDPALLGISGASSGTNPAAAGKISVPADGKGTGALPDISGKGTTFGGPNGGTYTQMDLTGESTHSPADPWYCAMRWPYSDPTGNGDTPLPGMTRAEYRKAKQWWRNRKIMVVNPKNNRAVVLRAADWGPNIITGKTIGMSKHAIDTVLGAKPDTRLEIRFPPKGLDVGRVTVAPTGAVVTGGSAPPRTTPRSIPGSSGQGIGERLTSDENLQPHTQDARAFIRANWNVPQGVGGYAPRTQPGVTEPSDHNLGLALDVMVSTPGTRAEGPDLTLGNSVAMWFVQNPLMYGTKFVIWNDRINFGSGWQPYGEPESDNHTDQHRDHVHISFHGADYRAPSEVVLPMPYTEEGIVQDPGAPAQVAGVQSSALGPLTINTSDEGGGGRSLGDRAIDWGMKQVTNPTQDWYRMCLSFVRQSFGLNGLYPDAGQAWDNAQYKHRVSSGSQIPAGVPVFWETSGTYDHVALSIGNGKCLSNDFKRSGKIDIARIDDITRDWNCQLLGWTEDLNGQHIGTGSGAWAGGDPSAFGGDVNLINAFDWHPKPDPASSMLAGPRAMMNDVSLMSTIGMMCQASMRSFMAAPNGDFIAWFPDYFGHYGTAARMNIKDIELATDGFTVTWNDESLVTHQFTAGAASGYNTSTAGPGGGAVDIYRMVQTAGIASVEFPELMEALFNVNKGDPRARNFLDPEAILDRFGARVDYQPMGHITGPEAEFWYACHLFQRNWASQFSSQVQLTFMPEVWPGMLLRLDTFGFQAYVQQVTHSFDFSGGGFSTSVSVIAPSATKGGLYALPRANGKMPKPKTRHTKQRGGV